MDSISFSGSGNSDTFSVTMSAYNKTTGHTYNQPFTGTVANVLVEMSDVLSSWDAQEAKAIADASMAPPNPPSS